MIKACFGLIKKAMVTGIFPLHESLYQPRVLVLVQAITSYINNSSSIHIPLINKILKANSSAN